jgi:spore photoproduct lyase
LGKLTRDNLLNKNNKIDTFLEQTWFYKLNLSEQEFIYSLTNRYHFTFQEFRKVCEYALDLQMWNEKALSGWWENCRKIVEAISDKRQSKKVFFEQLDQYISALKNTPKTYPKLAAKKQVRQKPLKTVIEDKDKNVFGRCPVESEKTVCCNLKTIDAVETCSFGCSYCTIQTFYNDKIVFDANFKEKLKSIKLDPHKNYHIGTGQSSDSLAFGNKNNILADLNDFALKHPNIILEYKTKSNNIQFLLQSKIANNIFVTWSLNPQTIIDNEEAFTASLAKRLSAARAIADKGVKIGFHFHPIIYYDNWETDYWQVVEKIRAQFKPSEIIFISFGSVTFIKPVMKKIRKLGLTTKILQMDFVADPHGKLTYADEIKIEKFKKMYQFFKEWHKNVFFYLCMEKAEIWEKSFGYVYKSNEAFENALFKSASEKMEGLVLKCKKKIY